MIYYHVNSELFNKRFDGEDGFGKRNPSVSIRNLKDRNVWQKFKEKEYSIDNLISSNLIIDFLNCEETISDDLEEYDWILLDVYGLKYDSINSPLCINGWLISPKFKSILAKNKVVLGKEHVFIPSKLRFQGKYLDYYLCQYISYDTKQINLRESKIIEHPEETSKHKDSFDSINELKQFIFKNRRDSSIKIQVSINHYQDILTSYSLTGTYASDKFKKLVEKNGITGLEFKSAPQIDISFPIKA